MVKIETQRLVRKLLMLSLLLVSLMVMSSGLAGNQVRAAAPCCSYCDSLNCDQTCDSETPACTACERAIRACYRNCIPSC
jgi:hypothetical protein